MKFKQVLAGLLVGAMVVTSAPVSGLGALSALAASDETEDSRVNLAAPNISATAPVAGEATSDAVTLDHSTTAQVFKDSSENPATLTSENVAVTKDTDNDGNDIQAFSGQITAANDGENNSKLNVNGDTPMVMKFRMKTDAVDSSDTYLMGKMDNQYGIQINSSKIAFYSCNSDNSWPEVNFAVSDDFWGKWHEVVAVYTGSSMKLFVDGKEGSVTSGRPSAAKWTSFDNSTFTMGYNVAKRNGDGSYKGLYNGKFADVAFYSGGDAIASDASYDTIMASLEGRTQILNIDAEAANENAAPNYTVATAWTDSKGDAVTTFEEDKAYTLTATLTAKEGYKFTEESKPATIKVGEENVEVNAVVSDDGNTLTLTHTFGEDKETPPAEEYVALPASALTGTADSQETTGEGSTSGFATAAVDGDTSTFWHSQYNPSNNVTLNQEDPTQNQNNNYYIKLDTAYTVSAVTYVPRTGDNGMVVGNGYITKCNVYTSADDGATWTKAGESGEWTYTDSDVKRTITFDKPVEGVTNIKFEVLSTKGETGNDNKFINAAEFGVIGKEESEVSEDWDISAPKITAVAPVKGGTPTAATAEDAEGYSIASAWTDTDKAEVTTFEAGKDYILTITLSAEEGYKFTEESKPATIKVGEDDVDVTADIAEDGKTMTLSHTFSVPKDVQYEYGKLEGLTGKADSEEPTGEGAGQGTADKALDGNVSTFWHTNWKDASAPKAEYETDENGTATKLTGNNTYTITLAKASTVTSLTYMPRNHYDGSGNIANGAISECEVYVSTDHGETWTLAGKTEGETAWNYVKKTEDGADQNFAEKTVTFDKAYAGVTDVKVKAIKTAGVQANMFINAAEFGVIGKEDTETPEVSEARKALAAALADAEKVESADKYTADSYKTFEEALAAANAVTDETSDEDVQKIADALKDAIENLKEAETPTPPVTEDSVITAPKLSYTAPVSGETAVVPSYAAMEDQAANPATLEQKDDVKTTVGEDNGVWAFQGRLTAPNDGANNSKFDVSGDTPMILRTKVKLNNKTDEIVNIIGKMDEQYGVQVDGANNRVIMYCCAEGGGWPEVQYTYDPDEFWGQWHDIMLVYTGNRMKLYVDGNEATATPGRPNASNPEVVFKSSSSSVFTIGYNVAKSTEHGEDNNHKKYSTLDQVDGKIADIKLYRGTDYSEGLTKSYDEIKEALANAVPDADISATPYTAETTWSANGTALAENAKFAEETVYTATTVYKAYPGFKFTDISKPSVDGATVEISTDGKTMTVTKTFPATAKIICSCVLGEITGVDNQNVDLGVEDSKSVALNAKAQVTGDCKVEGHDGTVNYTYTVTDAGTTGATVKDNTVTVTAAGTAKVKVTATLAADASKTSTKEITLTVTTGKASAEDKAKLTSAIDSVKDVKEADYTEDSYAPLKAALATANTLKEKANASKAEVDAAIKAINDAKKGLKTKVVAKKEELNNLLTVVYDDLMANGNKYTVASYNDVVKVYKEVKDLPNKENATAEELENAIKNLTDAKNALVLQETADLEKAKENASAALKNAEAIANAGQKDYEEASWKAFDAAYKALKDAPADADKATLESLTLALRNAQAALKKAETPAPTPEVTLDAPKVKAAKAKVTKTGVVVNVTVEAVKDAASYDVYRVVKGKATKVGTTAAGKTTVKDKKAVKGASYYAVAVSKDGKVVSKAGAAVAVKLAKAPKIQKATAGTKSAKLTWKKVKGAKVVVYRSTKKNSGYRKVATTGKNAASVTNKKGLKAGKSYYYKIATIKGKLISAMSKAKRVKIKK